MVLKKMECRRERLQVEHLGGSNNSPGKKYRRAKYLQIEWIQEILRNWRS